MTFVLEAAFWAVAIFFMGGNLFRGVKLLIMARKEGILKIWPRLSVFIDIIVGAGMLFFAVKGFSAADEYRKSAEEYSLLRNSSGFHEYLKKSVRETKGYELTDVDTYIGNRINELNAAADDSESWAWRGIIVGVFFVVSCINGLWIVTGEGLLGAGCKKPEPLICKYHDGVIDVGFGNIIGDGRKIKTFKGTPKNLAVFGRFIEWEDEPTVTITGGNDNDIND